MQLRYGLLQRNGVAAKRIAKYMNGGTAPDTGQFDAIDQPQPERIRGGLGIIQAFKSVVIGQRQQLDSTRMGSLHNRGGRQRTVRSGAMAMQINNHSEQILQGPGSTEFVTIADGARAVTNWAKLARCPINGRQTAFRQKRGLLLCRAHSSLARLVKQIIEFVPLLLFFLVYKLTPGAVEIADMSFSIGGIFSATAALLASSIIIYASLYIHQRRLEKSQWLTFGACVLFGSLTLALHSETILKWKTPVLTWVFAVAFVCSHLIGEKPLIQRMMGHAIQLPAAQWAQLNVAWIIFFLVCGFANLFVAFVYPAIWVDFKVFGSLGITVTFLAGQALYLARHMQPEPEQP